MGSDHFEGVYSPIYYEARNGKLEPLFTLDKSGKDLLLTAVIRDEDGKFLGKLYRNNFTPNSDKSYTSCRKFETKCVPNVFLFKDGDTELFRAEIKEDGFCSIKGIFHTRVGKEEKVMKIEVNDSETVIYNSVKNSDGTLTFVNMGTLSYNYMINACIKIKANEIALG